MKTISVLLVLVFSFLLKIHVYFLAFVESVSRSGIHSMDDFFGLFTANGNMLNFFIGVSVNLVIIYYTIKLKSLILKKILTAPIVLKIVKQLRNVALFLYNRYYSKVA